VSQPGSENNYYIIQLDKLWEEHFAEDSFPRVKKKYFDRRLFYESEFDNPKPLNRLTVTLDNGVDETLEILKYYWAVLINAFQDLSGHFFTRQEFETALKESIDARILRKRIVDLVLSTYSTRVRLSQVVEPVSYDDSFLQMRTEANIPKYRVMGSKFFRVSKSVISKYSEMFSLKEPTFEKFLNPKAKLTSTYIKMAHLIESFKLGYYEFSGGMLPQVFIRINDPFRVRIAVNDERYENDVLKDIGGRHNASMAIMKYFFGNEMSDTQRWNFVEDHFLGKEFVGEQE